MQFAWEVGGSPLPGGELVQWKVGVITIGVINATLRWRSGAVEDIVVRGWERSPLLLLRHSCKFRVWMGISVVLFMVIAAHGELFPTFGRSTLLNVMALVCSVRNLSNNLAGEKLEPDNLRRLEPYPLFVNFWRDGSHDNLTTS